MIKRKVALSSISLLLLVSALGPSALAQSSEPVDFKRDTLINSDNDDVILSKFPVLDDELQALYVTYYVNKPIHKTGRITPTQIATILEHRRQAKGWFEIVNTLIFFSHLAPIGAVNSVALSLSSMTDNQLEAARKTGESIYYAVLNSNGLPTGSLTHETVSVRTKTEIMFQYNPSM